MKTSLIIGAALLSPMIAQAQIQSEVTDTISTDSIVGATYDFLDEVVVTATKPLIQSDGATTTYNVDEDPSSKGLSVLDMLRKVPMVTVDGQDNIQVKGQSNFKIYVNGREQPALSANASTILKAMPSESVSKIELITEPGAKYDAEGGGGIINLVTIRQQKQDGYSGNVSLSGGNRQGGANAFVITKKGNVTASANLNYSSTLFSPMKQTSESATTNLSSETDRSLLSLFSQNTKFHYYGANLNLSWEPSVADLFTTDINFYKVNGSVTDGKDVTNMFSSDKSLTWGYERLLNGSMKNLGLTATASYQHTFGPQNHNFILSYLFNFGRNPLDIEYLMEHTINYQSEQFTRSANTNFNREHTVQADYTNPLGSDNMLLETGAKGIFRRNSSFGQQYVGSDNMNAAILPGSIVNMSQFQDIYALYASYSGTFSSWSLKGGVRYEHTRMGIHFHEGNTPDFSTRLNDIVPNAALTYSFSMMSNIRLAYQMRISRPTVDQSNPFRQELLAREVRMGNPDLESEHSNQVSLTYSNFGRILGGSIGIEYQRVNNAISEYSYFDDNIRYQTYANLGHRESTALSGFLTWSGIRNMRFMINGRVEYVDMASAGSKFSNHGWTGNYHINWSYTAPKKFEFSAYGGQSLRNYTLQGYYSGWNYYGLGVKKSFLAEDALQIGINATNFLQSKMHFTQHSEFDGVILHNKMAFENWNIGVSITWKFGSLKSQVKRTATSIDNDDAVKTGNSQQGGLGSGL